jgi:hypothetical protein
LLVVCVLLSFACGSGTTTPSKSSSDGLEVNATLQACPKVSTLTAIDSKANTRAPGNTAMIYASATGPNPETLEYGFSVESGKGTLSHQAFASNAIGTSSSVVFTCPTDPEVDTVRLVVADQKGAKCATSLTTATIMVSCERAR